LVNLSGEDRSRLFLQIVEKHKNELLDDVQLEKFIMIYPEWAMGFRYIDDLKKAIAEYKQNKIQKQKIEN